MAKMLRVKSKWTGFAGAPGYTNFYFQNNFSTDPTDAEATSAMTAVDGFWVGVLSILPPTVTVTVQGDVEVIEETDGSLADVFPKSTLSARIGSATSAGYSAASGAVVTWRSSGVHRGRRVRGRTFLVPCANVAYQSDGTLQPSTIGTLQTAANTLVTTTAPEPPFGIWARPSSKTATDGNFYEVSGATIPDIAAVLRSRRD